MNPIKIKYDKEITIPLDKYSYVKDIYWKYLKNGNYVELPKDYFLRIITLYKKETGEEIEFEQFYTEGLNLTKQWNNLDHIKEEVCYLNLSFKKDNMKLIQLKIIDTKSQDFDEIEVLLENSILY